MPNGGGVFFLEEFGIGGASLLADFGLNGGEELFRLVDDGRMGTRCVDECLERVGGWVESALPLKREGFPKAGLGHFGMRGDGGFKGGDRLVELAALGMSGSEAVQRVGIAGLEFEGLREKSDRRGPVLLAGEDVSHDDMAPGVIRGKAEGIDEFVFCRVELAEFVVNHGEVATGIGESWIGLESGCVEFESGVEVALHRGFLALIGEAKGLCELLRRGRRILDVREPIGNRDLQIGRQERELPGDFLAEIAFLFQILGGKKREVGELDDESVHRNVSLFVCRCGARL